MQLVVIRDRNPIAIAICDSPVLTMPKSGRDVIWITTYMVMSPSAVRNPKPMTDAPAVPSVIHFGLRSRIFPTARTGEQQKSAVRNTNPKMEY